MNACKWLKIFALAPLVYTIDAQKQCIVRDENALGDGFCNGGPYNTEACDYDGGDCCESTCVDSTFTCGIVSTANNTRFVGFTNCTDPSICIANIALRGDGQCHNTLNNQNCSWDGGDCCENSCISSTYTCGELENEQNDTIIVGFASCADPNVCKANPSSLGNGFCNIDQNTGSCSWDNGDCCEDTCVSSDNYTCGEVPTTNGTRVIGFPNCLDSSICTANMTVSSNGFCNTETNSLRCDWDGGDCCIDTCTSTDQFSCGQITNGNGNTTNIGFDICYTPGQCNISFDQRRNGLCDTVSNTLLCDWDGGDCCSATCVSSEEYECGFLPADPPFRNNSINIGFANCEDPRYTLPEGCEVLDAALIRNGLCNGGNYNTDICDWDGGDCCNATCISTATQTCGYNSNNTFIDFRQCDDPLFASESECLVSNESFIGNGFCNDGLYNTERCGWDGGDCCYLTCMGTNEQTCGYTYNNTLYVGFDFCNDPDTCTGINTLKLGDGFCDNNEEYNNAFCGWDGGDCCERTCVDADAGADNTCENSNLLFGRCFDPDSQPIPVGENCEIDTSYSIQYYGDGFCDGGESTGEGLENLNTANCAWDGGDCCLSSCMVAPDNNDGITWCRRAIKDCKDPDVILEFPNCTVQSLSYIRDGYCDVVDNPLLNTENCGWDGGDCCASTCESSTAHTCGEAGFSCKNPNTTDYLNCPNPAESGTAQVGNGKCDQSSVFVSKMLNNLACDWDGGDCCPSTCTGPLCDENINYVCEDPNATEFGEAGLCDIQYGSYLGDGQCNERIGTNTNYNTEQCGWDGGDCCPSTCRDEENVTYTCGSHRFECLDPDAYENTVLSNNSLCPAEPLSWVGDGICDYYQRFVNTQRCGWDGGDCCIESCEDGNIMTCRKAFDTLLELDGNEDLVVWNFCEDPRYITTTSSSTTTTTTNTTTNTATLGFWDTTTQVNYIANANAGAVDAGAVDPLAIGAGVGAGVLVVIIVIVVVVVWRKKIVKTKKITPQVSLASGVGATAHPQGMSGPRAHAYPQQQGFIPQQMQQPGMQPMSYPQAQAYPQQQGFIPQQMQQPGMQPMSYPQAQAYPQQQGFMPQQMKQPDMQPTAYATARAQPLAVAQPAQAQAQSVQSLASVDSNPEVNL